MQVPNSNDALVQIGLLGNSNLRSVISSVQMFNKSVNVGSILSGIFIVNLETQLGVQVCPAGDSVVTTCNACASCPVDQQCVDWP